MLSNILIESYQKKQTLFQIQLIYSYVNKILEYANYPQQKKSRCALGMSYFWRSGECWVLLHCHYFQVHSDLEW